MFSHARPPDKRIEAADSFFWRSFFFAVAAPARSSLTPVHMPYAVCRISCSIWHMAFGISDLLYFIFLSPLLAASAGGFVYYMLAIVAARKLYKAREAAGPEVAAEPAISLLKPLRGADPDLERHLESFFLQGYPTFEILFAVRRA